MGCSLDGERMESSTSDRRKASTSMMSGVLLVSSSLSPSCRDFPEPFGACCFRSSEVTCEGRSNQSWSSVSVLRSREGRSAGAVKTSGLVGSESGGDSSCTVEALLDVRRGGFFVDSKKDKSANDVCLLAASLGDVTEAGMEAELVSPGTRSIMAGAQAHSKDGTSGAAHFNRNSLRSHSDEGAPQRFSRFGSHWASRQSDFRFRHSRLGPGEGQGDSSGAGGANSGSAWSRTKAPSWVQVYCHSGLSSPGTATEHNVY